MLTDTIASLKKPRDFSIITTLINCSCYVNQSFKMKATWPHLFSIGRFPNVCGPKQNYKTAGWTWKTK